MRTLSNDAWRRQGSSIIFDTEEIQKLLNENAMVSLRTFFSWDKNIPSEAPVLGQTVLICGLETVLDTLSEEEAQEFLMRKVNPLVKKIQSEWTTKGIVFGFTQFKAFEEICLPNEEVLFKRTNFNLRISEWLWCGVRTQDLHRIEKKVDNQKITAGYYVAHLS